MVNLLEHDILHYQKFEIDIPKFLEEDRLRMIEEEKEPSIIPIRFKVPTFP